MTILDDFKGSRLKSFTKVDLINTDIDLSGINWSFQSLIDSRDLYLGRFSEKDIRNIIRSIGLLDYLESLGFSDVHIDINRDENYTHISHHRFSYHTSNISYFQGIFQSFYIVKFYYSSSL